MYNLKGFIRIKPLINNSFQVVSALGELSTFAMTFTKERAEYENASHNDLTLISFSSKNTVTGPTTVPPQYADHTLILADHAYQFAKNFSGTITSNDIANHLVNSFGGTIENLELGALVSAPTIKLPEWISWSVPGLGANRIKIWFSDASFVKQYDEYEIIVVPPVTNLDDLFREPAVAGLAIDARTPSKLMEEIQTLKNRNPETVIRAETFKFTSPLNNNYSRDITWHVIVYGTAGDNTDVIRNEIITHALNSSSFPSTQWRTLVPDLFRRTEFVMIPAWAKYAIPNRTTQAGIYSPITNVKELLEDMQVAFPSYPALHIQNNLQIFVHPYRSLSISVFGGEDNKESKYKLTDYFPDFITVGTTSVDFNRMSKPTQDWSYMLQELLMIAENADSYSDLPANVRKLIRGGKTYITRNFNNVQYMVLVKPS